MGTRLLRGGVQRPGPVLAAATAMSIVTTSPVFLTGTFGSEISNDLAFGPAALGSLIAIFFAVTGVLATPLGRLSDRLGGRTAGRWAVLASCLSLFGLAIAPSYWVMALALAAGGVGNGLGGPTANMIVADRIPAKAMGVAFGVKQSAVPAATFLGGLAVPLFVAQFGWRPTLVGAAAVGVLVILLVPDASPREVPPGSSKSRRPGLDAVSVATGVAFLFGTGAATSMTTHLSSFAVDAGVSVTVAGLALSAGSLGAIVVRVVVGISADRGRVDPSKSAALMMAVGSLGYVVIATGTTVGVTAGALIAFTIGWGWSGLMGLILVRAHPDAPASASGIVLTGAAIGGIVGPASTGWVAEAIAFEGAWVLASAMAVAGAVAAWLGGRFSAERRPVVVGD